MITEVFKWYPVVDDEGKENLPKKSDSYLVTVLYGEDGLMQTNVYVCSYDVDTKVWEVMDYDCVVAWAPLPKPYNGKITLTNSNFN